MKIKIPVSVGELIDKITILEIKASLSDDEYIHKELAELNAIKYTLPIIPLGHQIRLKEVNQTLWDIEDKIREKEKKEEFDAEFIELARSVYINNDKRAEIKREINEETNSTYREVKIFS